MKKSRTSDPKALTEDEIQYYYTLLQEEVTEYNCGSLCAPSNGGIPVCCQADNALPALYKAEYEMLSKRTDLWKAYVPMTREEKKNSLFTIIGKLHFVNAREWLIAKEKIAPSVAGLFH